MRLREVRIGDGDGSPGQAWPGLSRVVGVAQLAGDDLPVWTEADHYGVVLFAHGRTVTR